MKKFNFLSTFLFFFLVTLTRCSSTEPFQEEQASLQQSNQPATQVQGAENDKRFVGPVLPLQTSPARAQETSVPLLPEASTQGSSSEDTNLPKSTNTTVSGTNKREEVNQKSNNPASSPSPMTGTIPKIVTNSEVKLETETRQKDDDIEEANDQTMAILLASPFASFEPIQSSVDEFDKESLGTYNKTGKKLKSCKALPADFVWREFAPFFNYSWNSEFKQFAALFLAVWRRESNFTKPAQGVHVNPNCKDIRPKIVRGLPGLNVSADLNSSAAKDLKLIAAHPNCNLKHADFGPLQWNFRWRLSGPEFRTEIEKVLLLTTSYKFQTLKKLNHNELGSLVKYNPKALFLLGGLNLRKGSNGVKTTKATIAAYNTDPSYRTAVFAKRQEYLTILNTDKNCRNIETKNQRKSLKSGPSQTKSKVKTAPLRPNTKPKR